MGFCSSPSVTFLSILLFLSVVVEKRLTALSVCQTCSPVVPILKSEIRFCFQLHISSESGLKPLNRSSRSADGGDSERSAASSLLQPVHAKHVQQLHMQLHVSLPLFAQQFVLCVSSAYFSLLVSPLSLSRLTQRFLIVSATEEEEF